MAEQEQDQRDDQFLDIKPWLIEQDFEVAAYCCNIGNLPPVEELRQRALALGAKDFIYEDATDEFVDLFVLPLLRVGATYMDDYLLGTAIARPLIAQRVVDYASRISATRIAHGATGKGNDHIRFERAFSYLVPKMQVIAPWKHWNFKSRGELAAYLATKGYPWNDTERLYSIDLNIFHRSTEGGVLEEVESPSEVNTPLGWLRQPQIGVTEEITIGFEHGIPRKLNGKCMSSVELLQELNQCGSKFGIGLCDIVEERQNGIKSHGVYETPGGSLLHTALRALKQICWSKELYKVAQSLSDEYGCLVYDGLWFSDARMALEKFFEQAAGVLSGEIRACNKITFQI